MIFEVDDCENAINYTFKDKSLLRQCFTFRSFTNENSGGKDNERLEYLGDAILGFVVAEYLYKNYSFDEGKMTEMRKNLVSKTPLLNAVKKYGFHKYMLVGNGAKQDLTGNEKLFSSLFECITAGIYLDGGIEQARKFILKFLDITTPGKTNSKQNVKQKDITKKDKKSLLQEYVQKYKLGTIEYIDTGRSGPDHEPVFTVNCKIAGKVLGKGQGHSKKQAQTIAAEMAYNKVIQQRQNKDKRKQI